MSEKEPTGFKQWFAKYQKSTRTTGAEVPGTPGTREIDIDEAKRLFLSQKKSAIKKDKCHVHKNQLKRPTEKWAENFGSADVPGIDAPGRCRETKAGVTCALPKDPESKLAKSCTAPKKPKARGKKKK